MLLPDGVEVKIVQHFACSFTNEKRLTAGIWLHRESHPHPTQTTNKNVGMENHPDPPADSGTANICEFLLSIKL